jgi:hypothetical protein
MEATARTFMTTTTAERAKAFWLCYFLQSKHALEACKQHERCTALQHNIGREFAEAVKTTSMLAARVSALVSFARDHGYPLPENATAEETAALQLSGERFMAARTLEERLDAQDAQQTGGDQRL